MRIIGLDPGLRHTGWGVIDVEGNRLVHVADGVVHSEDDAPLSERLLAIHQGVSAAIAEFSPDEAAIEETFVNVNPSSTLKLGQARGVVMLAPALAGVLVFEYAATLVKKSLVGTGHAAKGQMAAMIKVLLPSSQTKSADAIDALAVAICHAHHRNTANRISAGSIKRGAA